MVCEKCGYQDKKEVEIRGHRFCAVCSTFAPDKKEAIIRYIQDKVSWQVLESFRKYGTLRGERQKKGMESKAICGKVVTRAPLGYDNIDGELTPNKDAARVHSLFRNFLNKELSLNTISKNYGLSVNGLKKVLKNRTYLGEIKFDGQLHKADHKPLISPEMFYAVQRKLEGYLKPRKSETNRYKALKGETEPLNDEKVKVVKKEIYELDDKGLYRSIFD